MEGWKMSEGAQVCTVGVKKKFPRSIRTTGARLKKMGGERELNGN